MSYFKAKVHQIRFRPGLRPRPHTGGAQALPQIPQLDLKGPTSEGREGEGGRVRRRGDGFFIIFKHSWAPKRSLKFSHGGPRKSWKSPAFFVSKRVGTLGANIGIWCCSGTWGVCAVQAVDGRIATVCITRHGNHASRTSPPAATVYVLCTSSLH